MDHPHKHCYTVLYILYTHTLCYTTVVIVIVLCVHSPYVRQTQLYLLSFRNSLVFTTKTFFTIIPKDSGREETHIWTVSAFRRYVAQFNRFVKVRVWYHAQYPHFLTKYIVVFSLMPIIWQQAKCLVLWS